MLTVPKLDNLRGPICSRIDRNILVGVWLEVHLEIMRHPHQMDIEEPILHGVSGEADFLCDDGREVIAHELGAVVPVAHPLVQLHLLQVLDKCSATSFLIQRPFCIRIMFYEPADAFI